MQGCFVVSGPSCVQLRVRNCPGGWTHKDSQHKGKKRLAHVSVVVESEVSLLMWPGALLDKSESIIGLRQAGDPKVTRDLGDMCEILCCFFC